MFEVVGSSLEETVEFYNKWNEEVKRTVPADRLLVHFNNSTDNKPIKNKNTVDSMIIMRSSGELLLTEKTKIID